MVGVSLPCKIDGMRELAHRGAQGLTRRESMYPCGAWTLHPVQKYLHYYYCTVRTVLTQPQQGTGVGGTRPPGAKKSVYSWM